MIFYQILLTNSLRKYGDQFGEFVGRCLGYKELTDDPQHVLKCLCMACQFLFDELMSCQIQPENNLLSLSFKKPLNLWSWLVFGGTAKSNFLVCEYLLKELGFKFHTCFNTMQICDELMRFSSFATHSWIIMIVQIITALKSFCQ